VPPSAPCRRMAAVVLPDAGNPDIKMTAGTAEHPSRVVIRATRMGPPLRG
jgi:hypothetical protein